MQKNILEWLDAAVLENPNKIALCDENTSLTYIELKSIAQSIGSAIIEEGVGEQLVAVISGRNAYTLAAYLGVLFSGGYYMPVDSSSPHMHIERILNASNVKLIIVDKQGQNALQKINHNAKVLCIDDILQYRINEDAINDIVRAQIDFHPVYVIFTSGSTGVPKGVVTSHRAIATFTDGYISAMGISENDIIGNQAPLDYVGVVKDFFTTLRLAATMVIIPKKCFIATDGLVDFLNEQKVSVIAWTVAALTIPIDNGAFDQKIPQYLRVIGFTGSAMHPKYLRKLQAVLPENIEYVNLYGPTELTSNCLYYKITSKISDETNIPIGKPFEGYKTFILNDKGEKAAIGEIGELIVGGSALSLGYYNNPDLTNQIFIQNPLHNTYRDIVYRTGDYCSLQPDGNYIFHGRKDRMVKYHGYRVELDEIEAVAKKMKEVNNCACIYNEQDENLYLFYDGTVDVKGLFIYLKNELISYKVPRKIIYLEKMPLMQNYKVDLSALKKMLNNQEKK